jgi:type 1 glutamine amidotransferase
MHIVRLIVAILSVVAASLPATAHAARTIDCPLRDQPYSSRSPLIDLLLKPEAVAVIERDAPGLIGTFWAGLKSTTVPSFGSIVTLRKAAEGRKLSEEQWASIDRDLARLPVTSRDKQARCARYDDEGILPSQPSHHPAILIFEKMTGFLDAPSVDAAHAALVAIAKRKGWEIVTTDRGGAITPANLRHYDVVIWNNVSGDALTVAQRRAFRSYIEHGGGFVGLHGAGGDPSYFWDWYVDALIGARFIGHPMAPQFQDARVVVTDPASPIVASLTPGWTMRDEWYSFASNPRATGAHILLALDEASYSPRSGDKDLRMGDHPIAWTRCVGDGRSFFTAIGHRPESYSEPHYVEVLEAGITWTAGAGATRCKAGREVTSEQLTPP